MKNPFQLKQHFWQIFYPPSSPLYHPSVSGIRAFAFLWIVALHCLSFSNARLPSFSEYDDFVNYHPVGIFTIAGPYGVDLFLLLSGFLLFETLYTQTTKSGVPNIATLLASRLWRLLPALFASSMLLRLAGNESCPSLAEHLMIYNYVLYKTLTGLDICVLVSWSISLDFQCWVVAVVAFLVLTKIRDNTTGKWKITHLDILVLILLTTIYNICESFYISPNILPTAHTSDTMPTEFAVKLQKELNFTFSHDIYNPQLAQNLIDFWPTNYIYMNLLARLAPFLYGILSGQIFYHSKSSLAHLHKYSFLYLPFAVACLLVPLPFSMIPSTIHLASQPSFYRNLFIALNRQVFTVGATFFFLLAISSEKHSKIPSPSLIGRATQKFLGCYFWYPISQLSYVAYLLSQVFILLVVMKFMPLTPSTVSTWYLVKAMVFSLIPMAILSFFMYLFVEMPAIEMKQWIFPSRHTNAQTKKTK